MCFQIIVSNFGQLFSNIAKKITNLHQKANLVTFFKTCQKIFQVALSSDVTALLYMAFLVKILSTFLTIFQITCLKDADES